MQFHLCQNLIPWKHNTTPKCTTKPNCTGVDHEPSSAFVASGDDDQRDGDDDSDASEGDKDGAPFPCDPARRRQPASTVRREKDAGLLEFPREIACANLPARICCANWAQSCRPEWPREKATKLIS